MKVDQYGNILEDSKPFHEEADPVQSHLSEIGVRLHQAKNALDNERYGHQLMLDRKKYLEQAVQDKDRALQKLKIEAEMLERERDSAIQALRRQVEKTDRYKTGAEINEKAARDYYNLENKYKVTQDTLKIKDMSIRELKLQLEESKAGHDQCRLGNKAMLDEQYRLLQQISQLKEEVRTHKGTYNAENYKWMQNRLKDYTVANYEEKVKVHRLETKLSKIREVVDHMGIGLTATSLRNILDGE